MKKMLQLTLLAVLMAGSFVACEKEVIEPELEKTEVITGTTDETAPLKGGQGGYITLVNGTNTDWVRTYQNSYQMNSWNFPNRIPAKTSVDVYVEWKEGWFIDEEDDAGEVNYTLEGTSGKYYQLQARANGGYRLKVKFSNLSSSGNPQGSTTTLGWRHNGYVNFILSGESGSYTSSNMKVESWMYDNLAMLGNKKLNEICITGSHDAGMGEYNAHTAFGYHCNTVAQSNDIYNQLKLGARYFDIRPVISAGKFYTGHYGYIDALSSWQGANGQSIKDIIDDVNQFTSENNELVILNLSHSLNTDVGNSAYRSFNQTEWNSLFADLSQLNNLYVSTNPGIDLTQLTLGQFIQGGSAVLVIMEDEADLGNYRGNGFFYYDNFNVFNRYSNSNNVGVMKNDQFQKMDQYASTNYFLLSWTLTQDAGQAMFCSMGAPSIISLANEANQYLSGSVYSYVNSNSFPNIIYIDNYINTDAASMAMALNSKIFID